MATRTFFIGEPVPPFFTGSGPVFPDHDLISMDDEQIKGIMLTIGATHLLADLPKPAPGAILGSALGHVIGNHPTHWFFLERYQWWPNPSDNGFTLQGYPKSKYSHQQLMAKIENYMHHTCIGGIDAVTWGTIPNEPGRS